MRCLLFELWHPLQIHGKPGRRIRLVHSASAMAIWEGHVRCARQSLISFSACAQAAVHVYRYVYESGLGLGCRASWSWSRQRSLLQGGSSVGLRYTPCKIVRLWPGESLERRSGTPDVSRDAFVAENPASRLV